MSPNELESQVEEIELHEPQPPQWLSKLAQLATNAFRSDSEMAPVGCHFHLNDENEDQAPQWEVTLFASSTEIYGGPSDGQQMISRFMLDLRELMLAFDAVESCYWQAQPMADDDQLGPHVGVEGWFQGQSVWLRITSQPPEQFEAGQTFDQGQDAVEKRW